MASLTGGDLKPSLLIPPGKQWSFLHAWLGSLRKTDGLKFLSSFRIIFFLALESSACLCSSCALQHVHVENWRGDKSMFSHLLEASEPYQKGATDTIHTLYLTRTSICALLACIKLIKLCVRCLLYWDSGLSLQCLQHVTTVEIKSIFVITTQSLSCLLDLLIRHLSQIQVLVSPALAQFCDR